MPKHGQPIRRNGSRHVFTLWTSTGTRLTILGSTSSSCLLGICSMPASRYLKLQTTRSKIWLGSTNCSKSGSKVQLQLRVYSYSSQMFLYPNWARQITRSVWTPCHNCCTHSCTLLPIVARLFYVKESKNLSSIPSSKQTSLKTQTMRILSLRTCVLSMVAKCQRKLGRTSKHLSIRSSCSKTWISWCMLRTIFSRWQVLFTERVSPIPTVSRCTSSITLHFNWSLTRSPSWLLVNVWLWIGPAASSPWRWRSEWRSEPSKTAKKLKKDWEMEFQMN